jgi:tetratricopeptide (TPR) repeat protein
MVDGPEISPTGASQEMPDKDPDKRSRIMDKARELGRMLGQTAEYEYLQAANEAFVEAARASAEFEDAWVWAARTYQELGNHAEAIYWWQGVLRLDPGDSRAEYFLSQAQNQLAYGVAAGEAFTRAVRAYQVADVAAAETAFREAVEANPEFAAAWGWLGRIAFADERYEDAAEAFSRAAELQPDNQDYAFFAEEARRLAGGGS